MRAFRVWGLLVILVALVAAACQPKGQAVLTDADKAAIKKVTEQGLAMFTAPTKDNFAYVKFFYTEDAIIFPPNAPALKGHEAILGLIQALPPMSDYKQETQEIVGFGDFAYDRETYSVTITPPGLPAYKDTGNITWIWRKQADGLWKLWREIWNSDLPAPGGASTAKP